jgi:uncharacterized sulfatase
MEPHNIVWITLDSVRSDHTSIDGYERNTTPNLAALGEEGYAFPNCIAHSTATLPSSGAILTGQAPSRNTLGVEGNVLPDEVATIPERFQQAGYRTACLSRNSYLSSATGLDRGFDRFQWLSSSTIHQAGVKTLLKYLTNIRSHSAGLTLDTAKHASPLLMNETAKGWLREFESADRPFFFYLHYNEPHRPYYPPGKYLDAYTEDLSMSARDAADFALDVHYNLNEIVANGCSFTDEEWAALLAMYDAEIAYTDEMVGRLIEYLRSLDLKDTIVVVTADHGELFGEYGLLSHSRTMHDAVTRVPLVLDGLPDSVDLQAGESDIVQHADVMATLLSIADCDTKGLVGFDLQEKVREFAVAQHGPTTYEEILQYNPDFDTSLFHDGTVTGLRTESLKYVRGDDSDELFELPDEEADVREAYPDEYEQLHESADRFLETHGQPVTSGRTDEFSGAVQKQLKDLGYME